SFATLDNGVFRRITYSRPIMIDVGTYSPKEDAVVLDYKVEYSSHGLYFFDADVYNIGNILTKPSVSMILSKDGVILHEQQVQMRSIYTGVFGIARFTYDKLLKQGEYDITFKTPTNEKEFKFMVTKELQDKMTKILDTNNALDQLKDDNNLEITDSSTIIIKEKSILDEL